MILEILDTKFIISFLKFLCNVKRLYFSDSGQLNYSTNLAHFESERDVKLNHSKTIFMIRKS